MLGPLPRLSAFSRSIYRDALKTHLKRPDGSDYAVFDQFYDWTGSVGDQRDKLNETRVFVNAIKGDVDNLRAGTDSRLDAQAQRITAVELNTAEVKAWTEALKSRPF